MARKFLYLFAAIIILVLCGAIAYRLFPATMMRMALEPQVEFEQPVPARHSYDSPDMWVARPDMAGTNPTLWTPRLPAAEGAAGGDAEANSDGAPSTVARFAPETQRGDAAIFFIHPTSYLERTHWNAPLDHEETNWRTLLFVRGMASSLSGAGDMWVPRYHQAAMGAFLTRDVDTANRALNAAYGDIEQAFDAFLAAIPADKPIILAGHSQGALHLTRLLRNRIAGRPVARRIVAAYVVGWPVSVEHDLPLMGLPACETAESSNCILSWQSFGEPADTSMITEVYDATLGFDGKPRRGSMMLCVNPITGVGSGEAPASANLGMVVADPDFADGTLTKPANGARCETQASGGRGFLLIGPGPDLGEFLLPGNNYHVFDYPLFWVNVRADAVRRLNAFKAQQ